jgi:hypothetical protein
MRSAAKPVRAADARDVRVRAGARLRRAGRTILERRELGCRPRRAGALARIVALLALYALALQGVLGGLALAAAAGPEHVLCLASDSPAGAAPLGKHVPAQGCMACCVVCHAAGPATLPVPGAIPAEPTAYPAPPLGKRPQRIALPRAPPGIAPGARAPPVA